MEDKNFFSPDISNSNLEQLQPGSLTSIDHTYINGEQETDLQLNQAHGTDQLNVSLKAGQDTPEEAEQWEQIIWPVRPMTCTGAPLSFATVQWDVPDPPAETPSFMNDSSLANELDSDDMTCLDTTSPSFHPSEDVNAELFMQEEGGEQDSEILNSDLQWTGNVYEPCDVAVQELPTQEEEHSTAELLNSNNGIPLRTDSEEEEEHSETSDPGETVDIISTVAETEVVDKVDSFVDLEVEEEQEVLVILMTGQGNLEAEQTSSNGVEIEEENKEEGGTVQEEQCVTNVSCSEESEETNTSYLIDVEVPAEPLQTENTGLTINPDKLIDLKQSELQEKSLHPGTEEDIEILEWLHEDPTGQIEELEMCKDVDQNVDPDQSEALEDNGDALIHQAENAVCAESSQEILEPTEKLEETSLEQQDLDRRTSKAREPSPHPDPSESKQLDMTEESEQLQAELPHQTQQQHFEDQLDESPHLHQSPQMEMREDPTQCESADQMVESAQTKQTVCVEEPEIAEQQEQKEPTEQNEQSPQMTSDFQADMSDQAEREGCVEDGDVQTVVASGEQPKPPETAVPHMNGGEVDKQMARRLAEKLYKLDGIQRVNVVKHLDKDNNFSHTVGEEYLKFFDFAGQTLDHALRSFLKVVILIGETQERERVLQHFSCRFHECNPEAFSSSGAVLALTCALMLLNTDLHGQHVGKTMSSSKFVFNLEGMNEGENFSKDLLKSLYNSIKSEPLEWAVDEEELKSSVLPEEDAGDDAVLRSKANPFLDVPHDKKASVIKEGFLQRKLHADIDGKRTPWGKRSWKTFYGVLKGMVLYLQKDDSRRDQQTNEEVVSVHHSLAEPAASYTKKPHVFRLQTADWRVFLFQASSKVEMKSWISRINLVSALHSSPPFPAAVGSQRKFFRPILPASQSAHTLERQLQSHTGMLESFKADLLYLQQNLPEGKKAKAKELEEHRVRAEYLQHEMSRYEIYIQVLEGWKKVEETSNGTLSTTGLTLFDKLLCEDSLEEEVYVDGLKKSHSSPSLELETAPPTVVKVRRNISERRTYRRTIIPRWNKEA
ncbi:PH and SEC7 domain-containing protein 4 [Mastacembelus armatus]|uniref:PH and SEC7 domain-containing protein 4-like n=1 Tax=Mastacembelus armatus TaxID=205130 RepID=A0A3Q3S857_9TELE|nr:PH and SEC7 domain-containing protein 4-like [Mastacembelus armatus]XP_026153454.1 PH and SEC7 domain-containing protein 4-like [Mastacembelus armatus]